MNNTIIIIGSIITIAILLIAVIFSYFLKIKDEKVIIIENRTEFEFCLGAKLTNSFNIFKNIETNNKNMREIIHVGDNNGLELYVLDCEARNKITSKGIYVARGFSDNFFIRDKYHYIFDGKTLHAIEN